MILGHRVHHVVDELLHDRAPDFGLLERPRLRAEHRDAPSARPSGSTYRRNYTGSAPEGPATAQILHPHDDSHAYQFCPRCGGALERRLLKPTDPERPVCTRCGFVFYIDPKIAVGTIIRTRERPAGARPARDRTGLRTVGVSRRLRRPRRNADGGRHPRGARGMRPRRAARRPGQHLLLPRTRARHRRLRGHRDWRLDCASTRSVSKAPSSTSASIPWDRLAFRSTHEGLRDYLNGARHPIPACGLVAGRSMPAASCTNPDNQLKPQQSCRFFAVLLQPVTSPRHCSQVYLTAYETGDFCRLCGSPGRGRDLGRERQRQAGAVSERAGDVRGAAGRAAAAAREAAAGDGHHQELSGDDQV